MRYFFHAIGQRRVFNDDEGEEFADEADALAHAAVIAREIAEDDSVDVLMIVVVDEDGNEVGRVPTKSRKSIQ
jgi:hypothetical protein